jgi:hypothetical protein
MKQSPVEGLQRLATRNDMFFVTNILKILRNSLLLLRTQDDIPTVEL